MIWYGVLTAVGVGSLEKKIHCLVLGVSRINGKKKMTKLCEHCNPHDTCHAFIDDIHDRQFLLCNDCYKEVECLRFSITDSHILLQKNLGRYIDFLNKVNGIDFDEMKEKVK